MTLLNSFYHRATTLRERLQPLAYDAFALTLRGLFGWEFFLTGRGKLDHLDRTTEFFASLGLPAPGAHALGIGALEAAGGVMLIAGFASRPVSGLLAGTMIVALATAHRAEIVSDGLDGLVAAAPFPYLVAMLALLIVGPGRVAVDHFIEARLKRACQSTVTAR